MAGAEREDLSQIYRNLDRDSLVRVLDSLPDESVKVAVVYDIVTGIKRDHPERLLENKYKESLSKTYPSHKVDWMLDAVDLITRSLLVAPKNELKLTEIDGILELGGIYKKRYVDPKADAEYRKEKYWTDAGTYGNDEHHRYTGPEYLKELVIDHCNVDSGDIERLLYSMVKKGNIGVDDMPRPTFHLKGIID